MTPVPVAMARAAMHAVVVAALFAAPSSVSADEPLKLDLRAAITLARKGNPGVEAARRRIDEARGGLSGARMLLLENPELEFGVGPRFRPSPETGSSLDVDASLSQRLEVAGQRSHRIARARAEVSAAEGDADAVVRALDLAVTMAPGRLSPLLAGADREEFLATVGSEALLGRLPSVTEVASVAAMMASDRASGVTGTFIQVTCGSRAG